MEFKTTVASWFYPLKGHSCQLVGQSAKCPAGPGHAGPAGHGVLLCLACTCHTDSHVMLTATPLAKEPHHLLFRAKEAQRGQVICPRI